MGEGFYKLLAREQGGYIKCEETTDVMYAPNFVDAPGYSLSAKNAAKQTYPCDGWCYFKSEDEMMKAFGLRKRKADIDALNAKILEQATEIASLKGGLTRLH